MQICYIVLEKIENGTVLDFVGTDDNKLHSLNEPFVRKIAKDLVAAIEIMNQKHFTHRDLKPANLMFDESFNIKIIDLGFAGMISGERAHFDGKDEVLCGTPGYFTPEECRREPYFGYQSDTWAVGIILF